MGIPKVICLICAISCCKDQGCPRCGAAVLMFITSGLELIWIIIVILGRHLAAAVYCALWLASGESDFEDGVDDEKERYGSCVEDVANTLLIIYLCLTLVVALHITIGVGMCSWYNEIKEAPAAPANVTVVVQQQAAPQAAYPPMGAPTGGQ